MYEFKRTTLLFCFHNDVTAVVELSRTQIPLFEDLSDAFYRHISTEVTYAYFRPGDFIAMRGNAGRTVYFIRSGEVRNSITLGISFVSNFLEDCFLW